MKKLLAFLGIIMLVGTLAACNTDDAEETYLTVDINPSVEFIVDEEGTIESYNAMNEDAEIVLADIDLEGMDYEEALDLYLEEATELGYIDVNADNNAVYISTDEADTDDEESLNKRARESVNAHFESNGILGAAIKKDLEEEYGDIAEEYDLDLGKARLLSRAVELNDDLEMEEAVEMDMSEIMAILIADHQERMQQFRQNRQAHAQDMKDAMKDQVREDVQSHRDNWEDGTNRNMPDTPFDFNEIRQNIESNRTQDESAYSQRVQDLKDEAETQIEE